MASSMMMVESSYIQAFADFIKAQLQAGVLSDSEYKSIFRTICETIQFAGDVPDGDPVIRPVISHAMWRAEAKLLQLHPELADDIQRLKGPTRER